jgi:hypothetical protein
MKDQVFGVLNTRIEVAARVIMKSNVFWIVTPFSLVKFTDIKEEITASIFKKYERTYEFWILHALRAGI